MATEVKKSLFETILDGAIDAVKRPFTVKRVNRAFESAQDGLEEDLLAKEAEQTKARENLVTAAKDGSNLSSYIQALVNLQQQVAEIKDAQKALKNEKTDFLG